MRMARPPVNIFLFDPHFIERRIADIAAGNQQRRLVRRIARINDVNLRAAIAIAVLTPRSMAAQVVNILRRRRDHTSEIDICPSKRAIVLYCKASGNLRVFSRNCQFSILNSKPRPLIATAAAPAVSPQFPKPPGLDAQGALQRRLQFLRLMDSFAECAQRPRHCRRNRLAARCRSHGL